MKINLCFYFKKIPNLFGAWIKPKYVLAIDIGDTFIHVLALTIKSKSVLAYDRTLLPDNIVKFGVIQNLPSLIKILESLLSCMPCGLARVVLALPDSLILQKIITVSTALTARQTESFVYMSAQKHISTSMYVDFNLVAPGHSGHLMRDVRVVAAHARDVQPRVDLLRAVGFEIDIMDVRSSAVVRALRYTLLDWPPGSTDKTIALIEFDITTISFYVLRAMHPVFMYVQPIDSLQHEVLHNIDRVMQVFYASEHAQSIENLLVAGQHEDLNDLASILNTRLNVITTVLRPTGNLEFANDLSRKLIYQHSTEFLAVLGLALR